MASDRAKREMEMYERLGMSEAVVYHPRGSQADKRPRTIQAIVDRIGPQEAGHSQATAIRLTVLNDDKLGISTAKATLTDTGGLDAGKDTVEAPKVARQALTDLHVQRLVPDQTDEDWVCVEMQ